MITLFPKNRWGVAIPLLCLSLGIATSQTSKVIEDYRLRFPNDFAVVLNEETSIRINLEHSDLTIDKTYNKETLYYSDPPEGSSDEVFFTNSFSPLRDLKAFFYRSEGGRIERTTVDNIFAKDDYGDNIFFDDRKIVEIIFPKVSSGTKTSVHYSVDILEPHFLGSHFFSSYFPVEHSQIKVIYPGKVKLGYKVFNDPDGKITITEGRSGKNHVLHCRAGELDAFSFRENDFSISYYEPHVIVYIDHYVAGKDTIRLLSDLSDLHRWYYGFIENVSGKYNEELKQFTDSLSEGIPTELGKAKALYYWVQDNIRYVAFEDGYSGFIPRPSILVYNRRYGDCKDMANLCCDLLGYAGIESYLTWVGTRDIPYRYRDIHTPVVDDHLIVSAVIDDVYYFLDPTGDYLPISYPSSFIQGKEGLISKSKEHFEIVEIPVMSMEENVFTDTSRLRIVGNDLHGETKVILSGYFKTNLVPSVRHLTPEKLKDLVRSRFERGNNKFTVLDCSCRGLDDRDRDFNVNYSFVLPEYSRRIGNEIYLNLNLDRQFFDQKIDLDVKDTDKKFDYRFTRTHHLYLDIPPGSEIESLPGNSQYRNPSFGYEITYRMEEKKIHLVTTFYINSIRVNVADFPDWNEMIDNLNKSYSQTIVLTDRSK